MTKRMSLALAVLGLSTSVFAGEYKNEVAVPSGVDLIAPDSIGLWSIGIEGVYAKSGNYDYQYAQVNTNTQLTLEPLRDEVVGSDYHWGGEIDLTYLFPGNSRDVRLDYTHLHFNNSDNTTIGGNQSLAPALGPDYYASFALLTSSGDFAHAEQDSTLDVVDLIFGGWIRTGARVDLHPTFGIRYANIRNEDEADYVNTIGQVATQEIKSNFEGIGPRVGADAVVHAWHGLSIVGSIGASLLVGIIDSDLELYDPTIPSGVTENTYENEHITHVIPELDARLGLDYGYAFTPLTSLNVQVGWEVVNYFDVVDTNGLDAFTPNTINGAQAFGYQGPYLRLQLNLA